MHASDGHRTHNLPVAKPMVSAAVMVNLFFAELRT
jgi:hypothetical protein